MVQRKASVLRMYPVKISLGPPMCFIYLGAKCLLESLVLVFALYLDDKVLTGLHSIIIIVTLC